MTEAEARESARSFSGRPIGNGTGATAWCVVHWPLGGDYCVLRRYSIEAMPSLRPLVVATYVDGAEIRP